MKYLLLLFIPCITYSQVRVQLLEDQRDRKFTTYSIPQADGTPGQVLTTDGAGAVTFQSSSAFVPGNETFFWLGPTASVTNGSDVPFFTTTPTRSNTNLGDSADIISRTSDTQMEIVNTGLHTVTFCWESSGASDDFTVVINGDDWHASHFGVMNGTINYYFTAGDVITVRRNGTGGGKTMTDLTVTVTRLSQ